MFTLIFINLVFLLIFALLLYLVSAICDRFVLPYLISVYRYKKVDNMVYALKLLVKGIVMLGLAMIAQKYFPGIFIGYVLAFLLIVFGLLGILPTEKNIKGLKLAKDVFIKFSGPQDIIVNYEEKNLDVYVDRLAIDKTVLLENPLINEKYYLPPDQGEAIDSNEFKHIINLLAEYFKKRGYKIEFTKKNEKGMG